jgi:hypothetical protein
MKKGFLVFLLAVIIAGGAFAVPDFKLSAGVGGYFSSQFSGGFTYSGGGSTMTTDVFFPLTGFGGIAFFDATYAELSLGFGGGEGYINMDSTELSYTVTTLNIGLLFKYPFELSPKFTLFPMLGIDYRILLSMEFDPDNSTDGIPKDPLKDTAEDGDFNALSLKIGVGADFSLTDTIYLRFSTVFGYQLPTKFENDMLDKAPPSVASAETVPGLNWDMVRLAVGFRF